MFDVRCSMFETNVQCSMFIVQCSMFGVQCSTFNIRCSNVQCSIISEFSDVQCSMFNVHCSKTNVHHVQCSTEHEQTSNIEHECSIFGNPCPRYKPAPSNSTRWLIDEALRVLWDVAIFQFSIFRFWKSQHLRAPLKTRNYYNSALIGRNSILKKVSLLCQCCWHLF